MKTLSPSGDSLQARFVRGAVWSFIGGVIAQGLGLVAAVVTARLLGKEGFGAWGMIQSTVGMLGVLAGFGLGLTATKHVAEWRVTDRDRTGRLIGLSTAFAAAAGLAIGAAVFAGAPLLASRTLNAPALAFDLRLASGLLVLNAISGAQAGALAGFEAFKTIAKANLVKGLLSFPLTIAGVRLWNLPGAVGGMIAAAAIGCVINHIALSSQCRAGQVRIRYRGSGSEWPVLWQFSVPALLSNALGAGATWFAGALLVNQPHGYAEMGVFSAANHWRTLLTFLPTSNAAAALPILASVLNREKITVDHPSVEMYHLLNAALVWVVAVPIMFLAPSIMSLYGPGFEHRSMVMVLLVGGVAIGMLGNPMGTIIQARGMMWLGLGCNLSWGVLLCLVSLRRGGPAGALGLAETYVVAYALVMVGLTFYLNRLLIITREFTRATLASALAFGLLVILNCIPGGWLGGSAAGAVSLGLLTILLFYAGLSKTAKRNIPRFLARVSMP